MRMGAACLLSAGWFMGGCVAKVGWACAGLGAAFAVAYMRFFL
jgi:hypothetical protein